MRRIVALAGALAMTLSLAGCGDDGDASGPDAPIKVMMIASLESEVYSLPWLEPALQAGVDAINADGGLNGRTIEASFCNDKFDPNEATACAQRAVSDDVVAVIGGVSAYVGAMAPVLEAANIPLIGPGGGEPLVEATNKMVFPISGVGVAQTSGIGSLAVTRGGSNVVSVVSDTETARASNKLIVDAVERVGGTTTVVIAPLNAADYASTAASVINKDPDGVTLIGLGADLLRITLALRKGGYDGVITTNASVATPDSIKALGSYADGVVLSSKGPPALDTSNELVAQFNEQMKAHDSTAVIDDLGLNAWMSLRLFAEVMKDKEITDGSSVVDALHNISTPIDQGGVYPDYPGVQAAPIEEFPQMAIFEVMPLVIQDGTTVSDGEFFNPFES